VQTIEKRIESRRARAEAIYREARQRLPEVCRVRLSRPSVGQSCVYEER